MGGIRRQANGVPNSRAENASLAAQPLAAWEAG